MISVANMGLYNDDLGFICVETIENIYKYFMRDYVLIDIDDIEFLGIYEIKNGR